MIIPSSTHGVIASSIRRVAAGGGGGFEAGDFNINDFAAGSAVSPTYSNTVTLSKSGTLYLQNTSGEQEVGGAFIRFYVNGVLQATYNPELSTWDTQTINVSSGNTFAVSAGSAFFIGFAQSFIDIKNQNSSGVIIDSFIVDFGV